MAASQSRDTELFRFASRALPDEVLHVIRFQGREGINELFSFTIELVSPNLSLDVDKLLSDRATFSITREDGSRAVFSGYPSRVEQGGAFNSYSYYTVELRPALWKMTHLVQSRIFLNQTLGETLTELLRSEPFFSFPFALDFTGADYPRREFAMQYEESVYDYLCWRLEEQGAYYYFEQSEERDTLHFADSPTAHLALSHAPVLRYAPVSGLEGTRASEDVIAFRLSQSQLPKQVVIRSYSWTNPNKPIVGTAPVSGNGLGDVYLTGEDVESDAEAGRLARLRAEALRCQARRFSGASAVPDLRPGYTFRLDGHHNAALNQEYLVTQVTHEGSQESFINLGLGIPLEGLSDHLFYRNDFACIEAKTPYRPQRSAPRAKISSVIHAFIDGESDGSRPEIDEYGRYKLLFPFDVSSRRDGKASCWIRRAQEQVGKNSGMSFPLLNGTEVLVSFLDGNPDRPYITGALANAESGALTRNTNKNVSGISTPGGNALVFSDTPKHQGIGLVNASGKGFMMGAGSVDAGISSYSIHGSALAEGSTEIAGIGKSILSGNTILNEVVAPSKWKYGLAISEAVQAALAAASGGLSEASSSGEEGDGFSWGSIGATGLKALLTVGTQWAEKIHYKNDRATNYGFTIRSEGGSTMSKLAAPSNIAELVTFYLSSLGGAVAKDFSRQEDAAKEEEKEKKEAKGDDKKIKEAENKKHKALIAAHANTIAELLPEIITRIVLNVTTNILRKENMGGVLLHTPDANIGLHAGTTIGLHAGKGMLLYSGDSIDGKLGAHYGGDVWKWGSRQITILGDEDYGRKMFNFYDVEAMKYIFGNINIAANVATESQPGFLADVSKLRYSQTDNVVEFVALKHASFARKHILASYGPGTAKSPGNSIIIQQADSDDVQTNDKLRAPSKKSGVFLTSRDGSISLQATDSKKRSLILGGKGLLLAADASDLETKPHVFLSDDAVHVKIGDSIVQIKNGEINLNAKKDGKSALIHLSDGKVGIYSSKKDTSFGDIEFNGNKLNGLSDVNGGAIKILVPPEQPGGNPVPAVTAPTLADDKRTLAEPSPPAGPLPPAE